MEPRDHLNPKRRVQAVVEAKSEQNLDDGIYHVSQENKDDVSEVLTFSVGGVYTKMVVDSGSPANIVQDFTYQRLKETGAEILNERDAADVNPQFEAFGSHDKIYFSTAFEAEIKAPGDENGVWAHFLVAPKGQTNLLSKSTAFALGVLKIGYNINKINDSGQVLTQEFPKIPNVKLKIQIDPSIHPVAQAARRLPIAMEADVEKVSVL